MRSQFSPNPRVLFLKSPGNFLDPTGYCERSLSKALDLEPTCQEHVARMASRSGIKAKPAASALVPKGVVGGHSPAQLLFEQLDSKDRSQLVARANMVALPKLRTRPFRTELTVEQNSLFVANAYKGESFVRESVIHQPETGEKVLCRMTVGRLHERDRARGVLRQIHQDVFYKLLELWGAEGYPVGEVRGKVYGTLRVSAYKLVTSVFPKDDSAAAYRRTRELLRDLQAIPIVLENVYTWQGHRDREEFSLLAEVAWSERGLDSMGRPKNTKKSESCATILFSSLVTEGFLAQHIKVLLLQPYDSLGGGIGKKGGRRGEVARLLYPFLDAQLSDKPAFEAELDWLAERFGLQRYPHPSKRLEKFEPAIRALQGKPILEGRFTLELSVMRAGKQVFLQARRTPVATVSGQAPAP